MTNMQFHATHTHHLPPASQAPQVAAARQLHQQHHQLFVLQQQQVNLQPASVLSASSQHQFHQRQSTATLPSDLEQAAVQAQTTMQISAPPPLVNLGRDTMAPIQLATHQGNNRQAPKNENANDNGERLMSQQQHEDQVNQVIKHKNRINQQKTICDEAAKQRQQHQNQAENNTVHQASQPQHLYSVLVNNSTIKGKLLRLRSPIIVA